MSKPKKPGNSTNMETKPDIREPEKGEKKSLEELNEEYGHPDYIAYGMCIGLALGSAIGAAIDSIGVGMGISVGLCLGTALGAGLAAAKNGQDMKK